MEIKAAWKELTAAEIAGGTFYTRTFAVLDDTEPRSEQRCAQRTMGLVGLHILYQPALFGNPEWVWATFEHRANVPTAGINDGATAVLVLRPVVHAGEDAGRVRDLPAGRVVAGRVPLLPGPAALPRRTADLPGSPPPNQIVRATNPTVSTILPTGCTGPVRRRRSRSTSARTTCGGTTSWSARSGRCAARRPTSRSTSRSSRRNFPCTLGNATLESFLVGARSRAAMNGCDMNDQRSYCRACNGDCVATAGGGRAELPGRAGDAGRLHDRRLHGLPRDLRRPELVVHLQPPAVLRARGRLPAERVRRRSSSRAACSAIAACTWVATDPACG